ncbi:RRXRR domain-containing protein [Streptomyces melanogenes]|uniref:RRXRR domain-containing protein n=1 Tax=Streptomyces melanogenes TaxID=67326 RepID=UPI00199E7551|nr:RRXRR domain-containing protein [Streptomyces melanogenes]GGP36608.1 hypothetical protein GCM10010278_11710 [Streptomyces melanogenes]
MPTHPARARELLGKGRAVVVGHTPFVIRLKDRGAEASEVAGVAVRIDPGSKGTGLVLTDEEPEWGPDGGKARCSVSSFGSICSSVGGGRVCTAV